MTYRANDLKVRIRFLRNKRRMLYGALTENTRRISALRKERCLSIPTNAFELGRNHHSLSLLKVYLRRNEDELRMYTQNYLKVRRSKKHERQKQLESKVTSW